MADPERIFSNVTVAAAQDYISDIVVADDDVALISFHFLWEGDPAGTFALFQSNLPQPGRNPTGKGWVPVPTDEVDFTDKAPDGSAGASLVNISATSGSKYIIVYSHASGSGNLDCFQVSKVPGATGETGPRGLRGPIGLSGLHGCYIFEEELITSSVGVRQQRFAQFDTTAGELNAILPVASSIPSGQSLVIANLRGDNDVVVSVAPIELNQIFGLPNNIYRIAPGKLQEFFCDGQQQWTLGFDLIKEIFEKSSETDTDGDHVGERVNQNGSGNIEFFIPPIFQVLISIEVIILSSSNEDPADIDLNSEYGSVGEPSAQHTESNTTITFSLQDGIIQALDVSSVFSALRAKDLCGLELDNTSVNGGYLILGILLRYI